MGASWFLNRMPKWLGRFLALTATPITANDMLYAGLADHVLPERCHASFWFQEWSLCGLKQKIHERTTWDEYLSGGFEPCVLTESHGHLQQIWPWIQMIGRQPSLETFSKKLHMLYHHTPVLESACVRFREASPQSLRETWNILESQHFNDLHACFEEEYRTVVSTVHGRRLL